MRILVDDLLDMSKMDASEIVLQREVVDLPALLNEISGLWLTHAESAGLKLSLDVADAPLMIVEDARRLRQILSNLLSNAVKFTPAGSIVLSARVRATSDGEQLLLCVSDTGIGVPEESHEMIFEKFTQLDTSVTRKYAGTGLGLSIARSLARTMGGDVAIALNPAAGCDFLVTLPLRCVLAGEMSSPDARETAHHLIDLRVVIVESNPITQGGLRSLLERRVDSVSFSPTVGQAIEDITSTPTHVVIASFPKGGQPPSEGLDRDMAELARACRRTGVDLVIIIDRDDLARVRGLNLPGASYLERPVTAMNLAEHLESLHDLHRHVSSLRA